MSRITRKDVIKALNEANIEFSSDAEVVELRCFYDELKRVEVEKKEEDESEEVINRRLNLLRKKKELLNLEREVKEMENENKRNSKGDRHNTARDIVSFFEEMKSMEKFVAAKDQDVEEWLTNFEELAEFYSLNQFDKFVSLRIYLDGFAKEFYSCISGPRTYDNFRSAFVREFGVKPNLTEALRSLCQRNRLKAERELIIEKHSDLSGALEPQKAEKEILPLEEEIQQEEEEESHSREQELRPEENDLKKTVIQVEEEQSGKKESGGSVAMEKADEPEGNKKIILEGMEVDGEKNTEEGQIAEDKMTEENFKSEEQFYDQNKMIEEERCLSDNKQNKEPETEEIDAEMEAVFEEETEETREKIENCRIEPLKNRLLDGLKADVAFILRYMDTGWTNTLTVDVIGAVKYADTGWSEITNSYKRIKKKLGNDRHCNDEM